MLVDAIAFAFATELPWFYIAMGGIKIDIFTTAKPFAGQAKIHQGNALRSWRAASNCGRIFAFGEVAGE